MTIILGGFLKIFLGGISERGEKGGRGKNKSNTLVELAMTMRIPVSRDNVWNGFVLYYYVGKGRNMVTYITWSRGQGPFLKPYISIILLNLNPFKAILLTH